MSWTRPALSFASGAAITLGSTAVSCVLALQVERSAHCLFFWAAPHWYARVDQAYGLTEEDLQYARQVAQVREMRQVASLVNHPAFLERNALWTTTTTNTSDDNRPSKKDEKNKARSIMFWNQVTIPSDEERILESAPL